MLGHKPPMKNHMRNSVQDSLIGLANILAIIAAFLVCPQIFSLFGEAVYHYLYNSYGDATVATLGVYVWTALCTGVVYFIARALIFLSLMLIAQRLVMLAI